MGLIHQRVHTFAMSLLVLATAGCLGAGIAWCTPSVAAGVVARAVVGAFLFPSLCIDISRNRISGFAFPASSPVDFVINEGSGGGFQVVTNHLGMLTADGVDHFPQHALSPGDRVEAAYAGGLKRVTLPDVRAATDLLGDVAAGTAMDPAGANPLSGRALMLTVFDPADLLMQASFNGMVDENGGFSIAATPFDLYTRQTVRLQVWHNGLGWRIGDSTIVPVAPQRLTQPGDIDGDGRVGLKDALSGLRVLAGLTGPPVNSDGDVDGDGRVGIPEVVLALRAAAGLYPTAVADIAAGPVAAIIEPENTWGWLGIPYAIPPVGDLRWRAPQDPEPWSTPLMADHFGNVCPQFKAASGVIGNEDCLQLNVWRPRSSETGLPVYVFVHGGGNSLGSAATDELNGARLAARANVLVVTVNYRLGPLGWLAHPLLRRGADPAEDSGNFALLDLAQALRWIRTNIAYFGGDPGKVTVAGESGGARNVLALLMSPLGSGLFHRAVIQSGGQRLYGVDQGELSAQGLIVHVLITDGVAADVTEAEALINAEPEFVRGLLLNKDPEALLAFYPKWGIGRLIFPNLFADGAVIPEEGFEVFESGNYPNKVPVVLGSNKEEYKLFLVGHPYFIPKILDETLVPIPQDPSDYSQDQHLYALAARYGSDLWKEDAVDDLARKMALHQTGVFAYQFLWGAGDYGSVMPQPEGFLFGAAHSLEIPFFFGTETSLFFRFAFTDDNLSGREALSRVMTAYLGNFIRHGDPAGPELAPWAPWLPGQPNVILLDADMSDPVITASQFELYKAEIESEMAGLPPPNDAAAVWAILSGLFLW